MLHFLKRLIAGKELAELQRYRSCVANARTWLAEFPDASDVLDHVQAVADGRRGDAIAVLHMRMDIRRDGPPRPARLVEAIDDLGEHIASSAHVRPPCLLPGVPYANLGACTDA